MEDLQENHAKDQTEPKDEAEEQILDFTKPDFKFVPKEYHEWRQQGPYLVCKGCEITHAVYIGPDKILVGFDKAGSPILKRR
jgi:hypothetical protein